MEFLKAKKLRFLLHTLNIFVISLQLAHGAMPSWSYDPGPNLSSKMGRELIDLTAAIPNFPEISEQVLGDQKFRPAFGPVPWRMLQEPNKTKILFIGQDATHIAEAAGRPATAGFGGRAQDLAAYFGVNEGAAFINTYAFTIRGQYGAYNTPYIYRREDGSNEVRFSNLVDNGLWLISQDVDSPIAKWRNNLIDWIIRNNKKSIKLIVTFGGAARDAMGSYIEAKGGKVGARLESMMDAIQIPETKLVYAGGNNQFPVVVGKDGRDLYPNVFGKEIDYTSPEEQSQIINDIKENLRNYFDHMVFTKAGPMKNGILHPAQLGGFDLDKINIKGIKTRSLKGLRLSDGSHISSDILVVELPHPTFLSNQTNEEASHAVARDLEVLKPYVDAGWKIPADPGMVNNFAKGLPYRYARADIGPEYYDFGTPGTRMVPVSTASRMSRQPHVIIFGTRERADFDSEAIAAMTNAQPGEEFPEEEMYITRPRTKALRYIFDPGPGQEYARLMKENLDMKKIFQTKQGKTFKHDGIDAYYVKNHPEIGDFGHYRGTFRNPKAIILADPEGFDDLITARALTGTRGQHLHGLMKDLGINDNYLVIKTVPFGMDGASEEDWKYVLEVTSEYRRKLLKRVLRESTPDIFITDGKNALSEFTKISGSSKIPHVNIKRDSGDAQADILSAANKFKNISKFKSASIKASLLNIPRSHLSFYARTWEGTSGDRVLNSRDEFRGLAFAEVAPAWAWQQSVTLMPETDRGVEILIEKLEDNNLPLPGESIPTYLKRMEINPHITIWGEFLEQFNQSA